MSGAYNDDEALAKALQEEYDREYRRRSRANRTSLGNSQLGQPESGTSLGSVPYSEVSSRPASSRASSTRSLSRSYHRKTASAVPLSSAADSSAPSSRRIMSDHGVSGNSFPEHDSDVDFARRLERAFREEERSIRTSGAPASNGYTLPPPVNPAVQPYLLDESFPDDETMGRRKAKADEELARRLQQAMLSQSAPVAVTSSNAAALNISPHSGDFLTGISSQANGPATLSSIEVSDAEFARRLQREISSEEAQRSSAPRTAPSRDSVKRARTARTSSSLSESDVSALSMISAMTDEEVAMKLQQELRDEEIARRLSRQEQTRSSQRRRAQQPRCTARAFFTIVVPLVLVGAAAAGIVWYFTKGNAGSFFPSPEDFRQEDPFSAQNSTTADRWRSKGQGLSLEVISALQDKWYPFFQVALSQWDNGAPDALTLTTSNSSYDYDCSPVNFKLKVCNGDYGNTRWRGINKILLSDGFIFASSARMNEYYFPSGTSSDQRQYTMCHEIGHGFGLPHTDESFTNKDQGNCMDYTNNPGVNKQPDSTNFNFLSQLYGSVPTQATSAAVNTGPGNRLLLPGKLRFLRRTDTSWKEIPDWVLRKWTDLDVELEHHSHDTERMHGWRVLHGDAHGEAHELDLGEGFLIQVYKLLESENI